MEVVNENETIEKFIDAYESNGNECRLCLKKTTEVWQLFEINHELPRKIMACAHVQIDEGDGLPTIICSSCRQLLDVSYNFKCQVEKSDAKLRNLYHLKSSSMIEYNTTTVEVNDSLTQSVNQVITEAIADEMKIHQSSTTPDNLKNRVDLAELTNSGITLDNSESQNCVVMMNELNNHNHNNNHDDTILFNVDINHESQNDNKQNPHHGINEMEAEETNENQQIIVDISDVVTPSDVLVEKLNQFDDIKEENCILADEESELSDDDHGEVYENDDMFVEEEHKIEVMHAMNQEIETCNEKNSEEKNNDGNDHNEDDENDDEDDNVDDDEENEDDNNDNDNNRDNELKKENENDEKKPASTRTLTYKCSIFTSKSALQQHTAMQNNNETKLRYVCYMCDKQFATVNKLKDHVLSTHDSLKNDTSDVGINSSSDGKLTENSNEKNIQTDDISGLFEKKCFKFSCKYCPKQFMYEKPFVTHAKRHPQYRRQQGKPRSIEESKSNDTEHDQRVFESEEEEELPSLEALQCTQCKKLFATKRNLTRHLSTHTGLKYNCPTCNKEYTRIDKLKEHEQIKHRSHFFAPSEDDDDDDSDNEFRANGSEGSKKDKDPRPHKCPLCPKAFAQPQSLTNHMERHKRVKDTQKRYLCEVCSKCFAQSGSLVAHMRTHTGVKPYVCNVCSRAFTKSTYLQLHLRTHSGEKPYICQYCSRAFARANTLARHITMHTGEAKYHCQICMKSFRRLTSLNEHTYTHTGQRPYACKICTKRYNNAGSLYAHTKKCKVQNLTNNTSNTTFSNIATDDVNNQNGGSTTSTESLIYSPRKVANDTTNIGDINNQSTTASSPSFIITNSVNNQKSPLPTNINQQYTVEESNIYTVNAKQFKHPYYTIYPNM